MTTATTNKTNAEVMYGNFTNVAGSTMTTGHAMAFTTLAASVNGNNGVYPQGHPTSGVASNSFRTFAGIVDRDTPDTQTGRYIAYGFAASVWIYSTGTAVTTNVGDAIGPGVAAASIGVNSTGLIEAMGPVLAMETAASGTNNGGGYIRGWVRAM
jgi:hypothetical protein